MPLRLSIPRSLSFWSAALVAGLLLVLSVVPEAWITALEFDRDKIAQGQLWRLWSGNFVHFGHYHGLMNAAGLVLIAWALLLDWPLRRTLEVLLMLPMGVGVGLWLLSADTHVYRGFSGANYGLLAAALVVQVSQRQWFYGVVLAVLLGKILWEQMPGYNVDYLREEIGVAVAIDAHLYGVIAGLIWAVVRWVRLGSAAKG